MQLLQSHDVARRLGGLSPDSVREYVRKGDLKPDYTTVGGAALFTEATAEEFAAEYNRRRDARRASKARA
jgi:hypothetical protein